LQLDRPASKNAKLSANRVQLYSEICGKVANYIDCGPTTRQYDATRKEKDTTLSTLPLAKIERTPRRRALLRALRPARRTRRPTHPLGGQTRDRTRWERTANTNL